MVRLTADLILRSPQYFNAVREREIDLRGNKIGVIENLGATEDQYDSLDLSDNEIVKLEGFPLLKRLSTLLISNNRIARINPNIGSFLPNLKTLMLPNNRLINLADLDPLHSLSSLVSLSLLENIVIKKPGYRLYVIHKIPSLKLLDFKKIKLKEREEARKKLGTKEDEISAKKISASTFVPGENIFAEESKEEKPSQNNVVEKKGPTPEQITAIKAAIATAQTLEEVSRLENALKSGQLPSEFTSEAFSTENSSQNNDSVNVKGKAANVGEGEHEPRGKNESNPITPQDNHDSNAGKDQSGEKNSENDAQTMEEG